MKVWSYEAHRVYTRDLLKDVLGRLKKSNEPSLRVKYLAKNHPTWVIRANHKRLPLSGTTIVTLFVVEQLVYEPYLNGPGSS